MYKFTIGMSAMKRVAPMYVMYFERMSSQDIPVMSASKRRALFWW